MPSRSAYDPTKSYDWNYANAPDAADLDVPPMPGRWTFCGLQVASPLGVAAGPLLNGRWLLYYASLGFDVLTYKTVRSASRDCYPLPNLTPVAADRLAGSESELAAAAEMHGSWAVSFGMPSRAPEAWRADVADARRALPSGKRLVVSVVGTVQQGWGIDDLAADYALCARWAVESGADAVETNFSCPNVATCDGQLYQVPKDAAVVARTVREAIGRVPLVVKVGRLADQAGARELIRAVAPYATGLSMTNSIATRVRGADGQLFFDGQVRGICGAAIRDASIEQTALFSRLIRELGLSLEVIGVGGASTWADVQAYLDSGASSVHLATAAMVDPLVAITIKKAASNTPLTPSQSAATS
jgi:dihydroorotate dehydrogenase